MKNYYIKYGRFANEYTIVHVENTDVASKKWLENSEYTRISYRDAIKKCAAERWARKNDPFFSGYGTAYIMPWSPNGDMQNMYDEYMRFDMETRDGYVYTDW